MHLGRLTISAAALATAATLLPNAGVHAAGGAAALSASTNGHRIHYVLPRGSTRTAAAASNNLIYNGGPVEASGSTNYAIFWEPTLTASANRVSAQYNSLISRFLQDVGGSPLYGVATQYYQVSGGTTTNIANSSTFGGSYVDPAMYPAPSSPTLRSSPRSPR